MIIWDKKFYVMKIVESYEYKINRTIGWGERSTAQPPLYIIISFRKKKYMKICVCNGISCYNWKKLKVLTQFEILIKKTFQIDFLRDIINRPKHISNIFVIEKHFLWKLLVNFYFKKCIMAYINFYMKVP